MTSLNVTWIPDLIWPGAKIFYARCAKDEWIAMPNVAALHAAIFLLSAKNRWGAHMCPPPPAVRGLKPSLARPFRILPRHRWGGGGRWYDPHAVSPLIELELRGKNEHVARRETKRLIYQLKVLGQPVTSEDRSSAEKWQKTGDFFQTFIYYIIISIIRLITNSARAELRSRTEFVLTAWRSS